MYVYTRQFDRLTRLRYNYIKSRSWDRMGNYVKVVVGIERVKLAAHITIPTLQILTSMN